jgi:hypothetical protein
MKENQRTWIGMTVLAIGIACLAAAITVKYPVAGLDAKPGDLPKRQISDVYLTQQGTTACEVLRTSGTLLNAKFTEEAPSATGGKPACPT